MDNFRVSRPNARPRQFVDGFTVSGARKQTPIIPTQAARGRLLPPQLPEEVVGVSPAELAPPPRVVKRDYTASASPLVEPQREPLTPFDLQTIEEIPKPKNRLSSGRVFRRWLLRSGLAMLSLLVVIGSLLFAQGYVKLHKVFKGNATRPAALQANVAVDQLKGEGDGRVNILLLGNGGGSHDAPDLTDTMIVESIDPVNKTAVLLSVPRDLWVKVPNAGTMKINAAYETGKYKYEGKIDNTNNDTKGVEAGFAMADQVVQSVLGIQIHYNALVNFAAFKQAVDSVGGVTVNVPTQLYDPTMAWENKGNPILALPGMQQMNGKQALLYVRSRETTSDFARSERQRAIMLALKDKILTADTLSNPLKISELMSAFGNNLVTDFNLTDAVRAYSILKTISNDKIQSLDLVTAPNTLVGTANVNGISTDQPKAGLFNYSAIQAFVHSNLKDGYLIQENARVTVLNGTTREGLATTKANELKSYGYNVKTVGDAPTRGYAKTVLVDFTNGTDKYTRNYLQHRYGVQAVTSLPDASLQRGDADFMVILGHDQVQ